MPTLIMKFGGTSVGSPEAISQTAHILADYAPQWDQTVVVISAMSGVTNALLASAAAAEDGDESAYTAHIDQLRNRHREVIRSLFPQTGERTSLLALIDQYIAELSAYCRSIHVMGEVTARGMDALVSLGERMNARIVSAALRQQGLDSQPVDATELIVTDDTYQSALPLMDETCQQTRSRLLPLLEDGLIPVVTGFIGATASGITTTLGRGGSDYTAALIGDCLDAAEVWTWTDVDGVMTADPRVIPNARVIPEISFNEISELAYFGAKVLHPKTIRPVMERDIPLWVKNTFNPGHPGTRISRTSPQNPGKITAVAVIRELSLITVEGRGMLGVPGIAARTFSAVAQTGASVLMISQASSEQSICFIIPTAAAPGVLRSLEKEMALELSRRDIDRIWSQDDVEIITAVGTQIRRTPGVAALIFGALGESDINVIAIAQGSSEYSISLVSAAADSDTAMQCIHQEAIINGK
ncbi:MAG TPA: aspartate kinase [Chloroflexi bacterium]|nr:aspartate kinase [Chloroflexota bacterium]